jgi:hypothetical protein
MFIMTPGVFSRVVNNPIAMRSDISGVSDPWTETTKKAEANWIVTTWIKTENMVITYVLAAISAYCDVIGNAQRRKMKGDKTAPSATRISLVM